LNIERRRSSAVGFGWCVCFSRQNIAYILILSNFFPPNRGVDFYFFPPNRRQTIGLATLESLRSWRLFFRHIIVRATIISASFRHIHIKLSTSSSTTYTPRANASNAVAPLSL
jgi:hypothetical protein